MFSNFPLIIVLAYVQMLLLFSTVDSSFIPSSIGGGQRHHQSCFRSLPLSYSKHSASSSPTLFAASSNSTTDNIAIPSTTAAADIESDDDEATVEKIILTESGCRVTLIGTAHLSKESNKQVERIILDTRPDVVMVEIDKSRLNRLGYKSIHDIGIPVVTADDIIPPGQEGNLLQKDGNNNNNKVSWWKVPEIVAKNLFLDAFTGVARGVLTGMYDEMSEAIENEQGPGGEFKAAIEAAKANGALRVVLGDRESTRSIRRAAELALDSGDPWGVFQRFNKINEEEMDQFQDQVKQDLLSKTNNAEHNDADLMKAMIEAMKKDSVFRERLFKRLENEVPEFTQALLNDRDYIMAESIRREVEKGAQRVVGVVGLAHVPGMKRLLMMKTTPLVQQDE
jgi:TraB/PrgY/gumN family